MADFRDPNVIWHAPTQRWIMTVVLSEEDRALLYASANLRDWIELSEIALPSAPGHLWECPLLIELPVEDSNETRWMFKVDVFSGAPGSGAIYAVGAFDGTRFVPEGDWRVVDLGRDFYAAIAWHDPRDALGRPCWIGWMGNHSYQRNLPLQGWRGAMSLPRRLSLRAGEGGMTLVQTIEPSCAALFGPLQRLEGEQPRHIVPAAALLRLEAVTGDWPLLLMGASGRSIRLSARSGRLTIVRSDAVTPQLDAVCHATFDPARPIDLWIDQGSIELLANDGGVSLTLQHRLDAEALCVETDRAVLIATLT
jgi:sucrose-6-phosphate hydrolase SacC (GH32 family)